MAAHPSAGPTPQRVCPHCATVGYTAERRCPFCRRSYTRHPLAAIAAMLLVTAAVVLGGFASMLVLFGNEAESSLDRRVGTVQSDFGREVDGLERSIQRELDRRLPASPTTP